MNKISLLALLISIYYVLGKTDKYVRISLDAKWKNTPLVLEARYENVYFFIP